LKKIDLGQAVTILANVGVLAGIVFLGIEIRDTNTQPQIATVQDVTDQLAGWKEFIAADGELSEIYARGMADFDQLSPLEHTRFDLMMEAALLRYSGAVLARDAGLLNPTLGELEVEDRVVEGELLHMLDQPGFRQWWSAVDRLGMSPSIVEIVDELEALRNSQ
jgi:hypothetical protein